MPFAALCIGDSPWQMVSLITPLISVSFPLLSLSCNQRLWALPSGCVIPTRVCGHGSALLLPYPQPGVSLASSTFHPDCCWGRRDCPEFWCCKTQVSWCSHFRGLSTYMESSCTGFWESIANMQHFLKPVTKLILTWSWLEYNNLAEKSSEFCKSVTFWEPVFQHAFICSMKDTAHEQASILCLDETCHFLSFPVFLI